MNLVCNFLEQEENSTYPVAPLLDGDKENEKYVDNRHSAEEMTLDTLDYWIQKDLYLLLFPVAYSTLRTPVSTAPVERVFSTSEVTRGKRNRLSDDNLERETLLCKNKTYSF